jgi:hypothetical protein
MLHHHYVLTAQTRRPITMLCGVTLPLWNSPQDSPARSGALELQGKGWCQALCGLCKAPFLIYVEVVECDDGQTSHLPPKARCQALAKLTAGEFTNCEATSYAPRLP